MLKAALVLLLSMQLLQAFSFLKTVRLTTSVSVRLYRVMRLMRYALCVWMLACVCDALCFSWNTLRVT
jgi:hypothetical protein